MTNRRIRERIAMEAARLLRENREKDFVRAKRKAAREMGIRFKPRDLPSNFEIYNQLRQVPVGAEPIPLEGLTHPEGRFDAYRFLLSQLEEVQQDPRYHPEGDALYHSLQVFDRAVEQNPYDEEFLTAALLHDVGKAVNLVDHIEPSLQLLSGIVTERTLWLIAHHGDGRRYRTKELEPEYRKEIEASEDFEDLMLLCEMDEAGRQAGVPSSTLDQALNYLQSLEEGSLWDSAE